MVYKTFHSLEIALHKVKFSMNKTNVHGKKSNYENKIIYPIPTRLNGVDLHPNLKNPVIFAFAFLYYCLLQM